MALANEQGVGRYNAVLHKLLNMKEGAPSPQLSPELMPVLALEVQRPEWSFLCGEGLAWGNSGAITGDATHPPRVRFRNPAGSGLLVVISDAVFSCGGTDVVTVTRMVPATDTDLATVKGPVVYLDNRWSPGTTAKFQPPIISTDVASAAGASADQVRFEQVQRTTLQIRGVHAILQPGSCWEINNTANATTLYVSALCRCRSLESSETR